MNSWLQAAELIVSANSAARRLHRCFSVSCGMEVRCTEGFPTNLHALVLISAVILGVLLLTSNITRLTIQGSESCLCHSHIDSHNFIGFEMNLNRTESGATTATDFSNSIEAGLKPAEKGAARNANLGMVLEEDELEKMDDAARALQGQDLTFTKEEEHKVLRKIDWRLMPIMAWTCGLQVSVDSLSNKRALS